MERNHRRTEILIETHEVKVVRLRKRRALALCEVCGKVITTPTSEQADQVLEMTQDEIREDEFVIRKALSTSCK